MLSLAMVCACGESPPVVAVDASEVDTSEVDTADLDSETAAEVDSADTSEDVDTFEPIDTRDTHDTADAPAPDALEDVEAGDLIDTTPPDTTSPDTSSEVVDTTADAPEVTTCPSLVEASPVIPSPYVPVCSAIDFHTDPPTSGPHYPVWATYKTYLVPVNPGFLVHSLKHGAIVITWRCPDGCPDELVALRELLNRRPADPRCDSLLYHRIVVAPRPTQDRMLVASAWGASFKADCFDLGALSAFIDAHYGQGLEDDCFEGVDIEKIRPDNPWYCPP